MSSKIKDFQMLLLSLIAFYCNCIGLSISM